MIYFQYFLLLMCCFSVIAEYMASHGYISKIV